MKKFNPNAGSSSTQNHHNHHHHHHRSPRPRQRSISRSSSSPSPPPPGSSSTLKSHADVGTHHYHHHHHQSSRRRSSSSRPLVHPSSSRYPSRGVRLQPPDPQTAHTSGSTSDRFSSIDGGAALNDLPPSNLSSPILSLDENETGFSTQYGASASSPGLSGSEFELDRFVSARGDETEVEASSQRHNERLGPKYEDESLLNPASSSRPRSIHDDTAPPPTSSRPPLRPRHFHLPFPAGFTVLPIRLSVLRRSPTPTPPHSAIQEGNIPPRSSDWKGTAKVLNDAGYNLTRRRCEDGLILGAVVFGCWKLAYQWDEKALAGEIGLLVGLSVIYTASRARRVTRPKPTSSTPHRPSSPASSAFSINGNSHHNHVRDRSVRGSMSNHQNNASNIRDELRIKGGAPFPGPAIIDEGDTVVGGNGCVWGTEEREYRECLDDGVFFALLFGPLVASAMLHAVLSKLSKSPSSATQPGWMVEDPLVLPSTPIRRLAHIPGDSLPATDPIRALSALATSRRNLVQLFTLCSFVLLVQLGWSLRLELRLARSTTPGSTAASLQMEREASDQLKSGSATPTEGHIGTFWLRQGKWRRNFGAIGLGFAVTAGCLVVKAATAYIGHGVWSDMSLSDIVIATLFYQFSLYVCVRLARRGFTLGELGIVCNAATALFMETVNLTRMKIRILRTPYIKTYRLPTPLLVFQLALIPGSLLAGFLLSPLLYLSRHLAQRPAHRLRFPQERPVHRRLLALGFYAGSALVCFGIVGTWTHWCLGRSPFTWLIYYLLRGRRAWTRPALISYWGILAAISVAGWNRQLVRGRRHRRYVVPGTRDTGVSASSSSSKEQATAAATTNNNPTTAVNSGTEGGISGVAAQMIDAADQKMPTLSVNARRKFFHALAVVMFVPGIAVDPAFTHLSFSVAFAAFNFAEYIRYFALWPFGVSVHLFLNEFLDAKDSGSAILSHFYLLAGCAAPLWLEGDTQILHHFGVVSLGIGDAIASIVGRKIGRNKWSRASGKTVEGSLAFFSSILISSGLMWAFGLVERYNATPYTLMSLLVTLLEAFSAQNDNLILPMYGWAVGILLGV